ncbi:hypothetical protein ACFPFX_25820 [Streptomyces mauvecolor]|uniref:Uncharacterized protein n=1 Tax=Streptomyces mauvecolor TaxID=58345 RepID=A0ABV9UT99_9ACTN
MASDSAAKLLSGTGERGEADRRAAELRDRLQAAGQRHRVVDTRSPGYPPTV